MFHRGLLSGPEVERLADGVMTVLERVGILCQNGEILGALAEWGASVDETHGRAWFPHGLIEEFVAKLRREASGRQETGPQQLKTAAHDYGVLGPTGEPPWGDVMSFKAPALPVLSTQVAQFFYDDWRKESRPGNRADFITLIKLGDVLHREDGVGHSLLLRDVPPLLEPLEAAMLLAEYVHRPGPAFAWNVRQVDYLMEMGEILGIPDWFTWGAICFAHPLRFDRDVADRFVRRVKSGVPTGLTGMQVSGATTPVTVAGYIVVSAAEFIATWIAARALNPQVPLTGSMWGGTMDMKTGAVSYCSPDAMLRAFAISEFLHRWCRQDVAVGGGEYCDAKTPGLYTALEKAYKAMTIAAFTGQHPPVGEGMLENGKTISPVQLLLDRELGKGVQILGSDFEITSETMALDTILEVGLGLEKCYLGTEHTLHHYRHSLWLPELLDRSGWKGCTDEEVLLERARQKVKDLISQYQKPELDPGKLAEMRQVVEKARRELLSS